MAAPNSTADVSSNPLIASMPWLSEASDALRHLALNEEAKAYVMQHPPLYRALRQAVDRFIGGEDLDACIQDARAINEQGHAVTIDFMGESTRDRETARHAAETFRGVVDAIKTHALRASVSLDLSHVGLVVDDDFGFEQALRIAQHAEAAGLDVMISAEGPERTDRVLAAHERLCAHVANVGITLQAYLHRTLDDLEAVLDRPGTVRLVKGAFAASDADALSRGLRLSARYLRLAERLVDRGHPVSFATHDPDLIEALCAMARRSKAAGWVQVEMLKGIASDRLRVLQRDGWPTQVYLPYGREWFLYLCNRLAEHPPNVLRALAEAVGGQGRDN